MKPRSILTAVLLAFVAACVVVLIVQEVQRAARQPAAASDVAAEGDGTLESKGTPSSAEAPHAGETLAGTSDRPKTKADRVVVYSFHRSVRCPACIKMEAYTKKALYKSFAERLEDGSVELKVVDYERPENEHFRDEFALFGASVVLVRIQDGKQTGFENLMNLVVLVDQEVVFIQSLQEQLAAFLREPQ
jgi:hypothetical protein